MIRRALDMCEAQGIQVVYHEDTVEVRYAANNKRFYTMWSQFLADAEKIFGDRMHVAPEPAAQPAGQPTYAGFSEPSGQIFGQPQAVSNPDLEDQIRKLKAEIRLLERAVRVSALQSEEWKKEVDLLKQELEHTRTEVKYMGDARGTSGGPDRYKSVRQIIVRRLHPDLPGSDQEKAYREKLFKTIWSEIEVLDNKR